MPRVPGTSFIGMDLLASSRPLLPRRNALTAGLTLAVAATLPRSRPRTAELDPSLLARAVERAAALPRLRALVVARDGVPVVERAFRGPGLDRPVNVKSVAKTVLSALVGIAVEKGVLAGVDLRIAPLLADKLPRDADPRLHAVTVGHLLSMRAGLERTSGPFYGRWVTSPD